MHPRAPTAPLRNALLPAVAIGSADPALRTRLVALLEAGDDAWARLDAWDPMDAATSIPRTPPAVLVLALEPLAFARWHADAPATVRARPIVAVADDAALGDGAYVVADARIGLGWLGPASLRVAVETALARAADRGRAARAGAPRLDDSAARIAERLRLAQRAGAVGVFDWEVDTGIVTWTDELRQLVGVGPDFEASAEAWNALIHADDRAAQELRLRRTVAARRPTSHGEYRIVRRDTGELRWLKTRAEFTYDDTGRPVRLVGTAHDVTEERATRDALRRSEARLRMLFDAAPTGIAEMDAAGRFTYVNRAFCTITGYHAATLLAGFTTSTLTEPDDRAAEVRSIADALRRDAGYALEKRIVRPDGTRAWVHVRASIVRDDLGGRAGWIATFDDVSERHRAEAALRASEAQARESERRAEAALREAQAASAAKDQFLAVLSHELRTPLAPVRLLASMLLRRDDLPTPARDQIAIIRRNVDLEVKLIDDLLDLTRVVRGKLELALEPVELHAQLQETLRMVEADAEAQGLALALDLAPTPLRLLADPARLQQVLWNLVRNAVKFTPAGGTVTIRTRAGDGVATLEVRDTGVGIAADRLPHVFTAFEQGGADVTRQFGGLGLGLAISRAIVERHGGAITAASDGPGRGATFTVELPLPVRAPRPVLPVQSTALPSAPPSRVLLVEDHADTGAAVAALLTQQGHAVVTVATIADAEAAVRRESWDVLVSDLGLPDGSGIALLESLRTAPPPHGVPPAIAMSGFGMEHDVARTQAAGFVTHLVKPVGASSLERALATALLGTAAG